MVLASVDALACYRGMDIGTAKPTRASDAASRHRWHLVDLVEVDEEFSVADFQRAAGHLVDEAHGAGRPVVFVGGTGLYHRAVVDGLALPGRYPAVAARLESEADAPGGLERLYERLSALDPVAAGRIEPGNRRRIVRALEVTEGSGRRFSEFGPGLTSYPPTTTVLVGLALERAELDRRLARRLEAQLDEGFLEEVKELAETPGGLSRTARQAIGYRQILDHLEGRCSLDEALAATLTQLRRFARRQEAWFRRDPRVLWIGADDPERADRVLAVWEDAAR